VKKGEMVKNREKRKSQEKKPPPVLSDMKKNENGCMKTLRV
jgi:hypothetical protein